MRFMFTPHPQARSREYNGERRMRYTVMQVRGGPAHIACVQHKSPAALPLSGLRALGIGR